uniref:Receptor-type protein tyrosine kinase n=1 Tax=Monosiga ovata TaxID=81526 RepID=B3XVV3_9EUKA|nr:receptor-type protein tyrosine kinase [Monosiga ovata]
MAGTRGPSLALLCALACALTATQAKLCSECYMFPNSCPGNLIVNDTTVGINVPACNSTYAGVCCGPASPATCTLGPLSCGTPYQATCPNNTVSLFNAPTKKCSASCPPNYAQELPSSAFCVATNCLVVSGRDTTVCTTCAPGYALVAADGSCQLLPVLEVTVASASEDDSLPSTLASDGATGLAQTFSAPNIPTRNYASLLLNISATPQGRQARTAGDNLTATATCVLTVGNVKTTFYSNRTNILFNATVGNWWLNCTGKDSNNVTATIGTLISIVDVDPPVVRCQGDLVFPLPWNMSYVTYVYPTRLNVTANPPEAWDNVGIKTNTCTNLAGTGTRFVGMSFTTRKDYANGTLNTVKCTVTDNAGNSAYCTYNVTVYDITPPVITCPNDIYPNTSSRNYTTASYSAKCTDNVQCAVTKCFPPSGSQFGVGITPITCTSTDASLQNSSCTFNAITNDIGKPVLRCPNPTSYKIYVPSNNNVTTTIYPVTVTDNSGVDITSTLICTTDGEEIGYPDAVNLGIGVYNGSCTATDPYNNTKDCDFIVTVLDITVPSLSCPSIVIATTNTNLSTSNKTFTYTTNDNVGVASSYCNPASGSAFRMGTTYVTCRSTDTSNNARTCTFPYVVSDNQSPIVSCPANSKLNTTKSNNVTVTVGTPSAWDNVQVSSRSLAVSYPFGYSGSLPLGTSSFLMTLLGTAIFSYTAVDSTGLSATCSWSITVVNTGLPIDLTAPVIANCPSTPIYGIPSNIISSYVNPYIINATTGLNLGYAIVNWPDMSATDNSGSVTSGYYSWSLTPGPALVGEHLVGYQAVDPSGNIASCVFIVEVFDQQAPTFPSCPTNIVAYTGPTANATLITSWPPNGVLPSDNVGLATPTGICTSEPSGYCPFVGQNTPNFTFPVGSYQFTYEAYDTSGNAATPCTFSVTVIDNGLPTLTGCPPVGTLVTVSTLPDQALGDISSVCPNFTASDNVGLTYVNYTSVPAGYDCLTKTLVPITTGMTMTYAVEDAAGNRAACTFIIRVVDNQPPNFTTCGELTATFPNPQFLMNLGLVGTDQGKCTAALNLPSVIAATDNSNTVSLASVSIPSGLSVNSGFPTGLGILIYTAQDPSLNLASCEIIVDVEDQEKPRILNCPSVDNTTYRYVINTTLGLSTGSFIMPNLTATDNCGTPRMSYYPSFLSSNQNATFAYSSGVVDVEFTAADDAQNSVSCKFQVLVRDIEPPVMVNCPPGDPGTPGLYTRTTDPGSSGTRLVLPFVTAIDNVGTVFVTPSSVPAGYANSIYYNIGQYSVKYTASDLSNNIASCSINITVLDVEYPRIIVPSDITVSIMSEYETAAYVSWRTPVFATDNVFVVGTSASMVPGNFTPGTYSVYWYAWDASNNNASAFFNVTVLAFIPAASSSASTTAVTAAGGAGGGILLLLLIALVVILVIRRRHQRALARASSGYAELLSMSDEYILARARAIQSSLMVQRQSAPPVLVEKEFVHPERKFAPPPTTLAELETYMRETVGKEIDRADLTFGAELGAGEFGQVFEGYYLGEGRGEASKLTVAIKLLKSDGDVSSTTKARFLKEAAIMAQFNHPNIVSLVGVCTLPQKEPTLIVLEYMHLGSLHGYLLSPLVKGQVENITMVRMALDIVAGMQYLSEAGFVHRDLAARNVLLDKYMVCRIGDFGLSVDAMAEEGNGIYSGEEGARIPVRWTSLEAVTLRQFSSASDVWSFGVVLWEIWTYCQMPYGGWNNKKVIEQVSNGYRLPRPEECPYEIYKLMIECWNKNVARRATFLSARRSLIEVWKDLAGEVDPADDAPLYDNKLGWSENPDEEFGFGATGNNTLYDNGLEDPEMETKPVSKGVSDIGDKFDPLTNAILSAAQFATRSFHDDHSKKRDSTTMAHVTQNPIYDADIKPTLRETALNAPFLRQDIGYLHVGEEEQRDGFFE